MNADNYAVSLTDQEKVGDAAVMPGVIHLDSETDVRALLDAFYNRGYRELDTASNYAGSEARLGQADAPSRFTIHTKVKGVGEPGVHEPANVMASIEQSLTDLGTSSVQTMFLHVPDRQTPFVDVARAINDAFQDGKFKHLGLSNYSAAEVQRFVEVCEREGYVKPSVYQGHYNAVTRGGENDLFPLCRKHNLAFFAYSPAAGGFFSDRTNTSSKRWDSDNAIGDLYSTNYGKPAVQASVATVKAAAAKHGIDGHAAAIRWTTFHSMLDGKYGDGVIFGVSKLEQLHKTLDALEAGPLPAELADAMGAIYETIGGDAPAYHL